MNIDKDNVLFFLNKAEEARYDKDYLKTIYGDKVFPFDIKETDTQGFLLKQGNNLIIAFRGTQQVPDWFTDLDGFQVVYPYDNKESKIKVHKGFINAYKSVRDFIHSQIGLIKPTTIAVCGHSLGGALSTLCAVDIEYNFSGIPIVCYTSGQPKVGNKEFVESYNNRVPNTIRTYMRRDIVPLCPPSWLEKLAGGKYFHAGTPNPIGPKVFMFGILNWIFRINKDSLVENFTNHAISLYRKFLINKR